jgi:hypothetical protein
MARNFVNGTTDRIYWDPISGDMNNSQAFSFSCWAQFDLVTSTQYLFNINNSTDNGQGLTVWLSNNGILNYTQKQATDSTYVATTTGDVTTGSAWRHVCVTHDGSTTATNCAIYLDGTALTHTTDQNGVGAREAATGDWMVGGRWVGDDTRTFDGGLCLFGVWEGYELTTSQVTLLSEGQHPWMVHKDNLIWAPPLFSGAGPDPISAKISTKTGTNTQIGPHVTFGGQQPLFITGSSGSSAAPLVLYTSPGLSVTNP